MIHIETLSKGAIAQKKRMKEGRNPFFTMKNKHHTKETKIKIGNSNRGKPHPPFSLKTRKKISEANFKRYNDGGKLQKQISEKLKGEKSPLWRGGISSENEKLRASVEYKLWRKSVFERDNYTCIWCGQRGAKLEADHIKRWSDYPELRFAIDNGRTLCVSCHKKTDTYGKKRSLRF